VNWTAAQLIADAADRKTDQQSTIAATMLRQEIQDNSFLSHGGILTNHFNIGALATPDLLQSG
jgi:hypothetical protein